MTIKILFNSSDVEAPTSELDLALLAVSAPEVNNPYFVDSSTASAFLVHVPAGTQW